LELLLVIIETAIIRLTGFLNSSVLILSILPYIEHEYILITLHIPWELLSNLATYSDDVIVVRILMIIN